jgi:hypothetical protein
MDLTIVFPMFWGRKKKQVVLDGDYFYDHPTALDDEGTIPPLFESLGILQDRDFDVVAVAGANHPSIEEPVEKAASTLLARYSTQAGVKVHFFSYSHLQRLHDYFREIGKVDLVDTVGLVGYSPLRNACLVAAHILGKEIAVSIDDDCLMADPNYVARIKSRMLTDFDGRPIMAYCGPYITPQDAILLDMPQSPHSAYWNVIEVMNAAFKQFIVDSPGLKEVSFAIMGNIAVHRDLFTKVPLDPPMQRGEDMDWVMNSHILGERFIMDTDLLIKHDPAPRPYPVWRPLREDIYRFRYQQAKIANSFDGDGHFKLDRSRYLPYPGTFFQDDFLERVTHASEILAIDYLTQGKPLDAQEALANIYHAKFLAPPDFDPYQSFLKFQKRWEEMMGVIEDRRAEIKRRVFE